MNERAKQWFAILGGACAWFVHLAAGSVIGESACVREGALFVFLGISAAGWLLTGVTLLTLAVCLWSIRVGLTLRKDERESVRFMGNAGVASGLLFVLVILAQTSVIPVFWRGC